MKQRTLLLRAIWLGAATILGVALLVAESKAGPLDDPDPAHQRPGFLDALGPPFPAPAVTDRLPSGEGRTVAFFTRPELAVPLARSLSRPWGLPADARAVVVLSGPAPSDAAFEAPVVEDPEGRLAADFAMPRPKDAGPPVGYAIVDRARLVRYRTLDPGMADRLDEVATMVKATP